MTTQFSNKLLALSIALGLVFSVTLLAPAAMAHDNSSGAQGCHSHEDEGKQHCH